MLSRRSVENTLILITTVVLALNAVFKIAAYTVLNRAQARVNGDELWSVERKEVALELDSWTRYTLSGAEQWAPLFPEGGVIHLGSARTPYTVSMMHQLRCLDVVREQLTRPKAARDSPAMRHCMNYLRQMVMCRGDLQLDTYQYAHSINAVHPHAIRRCKDWRPVYEKVWENQKAHSRWVEERGNSSAIAG